MTTQLKNKIKAAVKVARKNATPNIINVNDVIAASLFVSGGTLDNSNANEIKAYLNCNLSPYELSCGYVQKIDDKGVETCLYRECGVYHVTKYDFNNSKRIFWESFETLTPARKLFNKQVKI